MKLFYKKVGDTFTLDEYNAMCYLLSLQTYSETFEFDDYSYSGEYGEYSIVDDDEVLVRNTTGYLINKKDKTFKISINPYIANANFTLVLEVYQLSTIVDEDIQFVLHSNELYDYFEEEEKNIIEELKTKEVKIPLKNKITKIKPEDLGLTNDDWISKNAKIIAEYSEPILNWTDGEANSDDQIICETFSELEQVIHTTPKNGYVNIKLKGRTVYEFNKEIIINENKKVHITGGNSYNGSHAILDGKDQFRHFYVEAGSSLTIRNCSMINGNGSVVNNYLDLPRRGGSILMNSNFINTVAGYSFNPSIVTLENCKFINCHANRGGAICNIRGKLSCNNVWFDNCVATKDGDKSPCWGGAILNESVTMYHDSSNQLYIDRSTVTYTDSKNTIIDLKVSKTQNVRNFMNSKYKLPKMTCVVDGNKYEATSVKTSQFNYILTIKDIKIVPDTKFYLICNDFITRNLIVKKEGDVYYAIVAPEESG